MASYLRYLRGIILLAAVVLGVGQAHAYTDEIRHLALKPAPAKLFDLAQFNGCPAGFCPGGAVGSGFGPFGGSCPAAVQVAGAPCPDVSLNFAAGTAWVKGPGYVSLSSLLSITNATGGYVTDWSGAMTLVPPNTLRRANGTGLLAEESRQNLVFYSELLSNAYWTKINTNVTDGATTAPNGALVGELVARTSTAASAYYQSNPITVTASQTYTLTRIVKAATIDGYYGLRIQGAFPIRADGLFNLNNCSVVGASATTFSGQIATASWLGGWCLIRLTATIDAGTTSVNLIHGPAPSTATVGGWEGTSATLSNAYSWGGNFEQRAFPSSYCPTTSAVATCSADVISPIGALATALSGSSVSILAQTYGAATSSRIIGKSTATTGYLFVNSSTAIGSFDNVGTALTASLPVGSFGAQVRSAFAGSPSGQTVVAGGGTVGTTSTALSPIPSFLIGSANGGSYINGTLSLLNVWGLRLSDTALQTVTAPQPVLLTDFANGIYRWNGYDLGAGALTSLFSVANSGGYCTTSAGLLVNNSSNTMRVCSGTGALPEDTRTNMVKSSQVFTNANWSNSNTTTTDNATTAPDGTSTAALIVENSATGVHQIGSTPITAGVTGSTVYTQSGYLKKRDYDWVQLVANDGFVQAYSNINLSTCTKGNSGGGTSASVAIGPSSNGWCRLSLTWTTNASTTQILWRVYGLRGVGDVASAGPSYAGDGVSGFYVWCAQFEQASFPSSCITTTSAAVTRNFDNIQALGPVLNLLGPQGANSAVMSWTQNQYYASGAAPIRQYTAYWFDVGNTRWAVRSADTTGPQPTVVIGNGVGNQNCPLSGASLAAGSSVKFAFRWNTTSADQACSTNNGATASNAVQFGGALGAPFYIGGAGISTGNLNSALGCLGFFPGGLTNTQLQAPGAC